MSYIASINRGIEFIERISPMNFDPPMSRHMQV